MSPRPIATPTVPVSWGELIDKVTILEIKSAKIANPAALANIRRELAWLQAIAQPILAEDLVAGLKRQLKEVNEALWQIEDHIREKEAAAEFDSEFIELARSVYKRNDERSALKRQINAQLNSEIVEEKSYAAY
jgi:hypothetical protein